MRKISVCFNLICLIDKKSIKNVYLVNKLK